jgi:hypothetical protein
LFCRIADIHLLPVSDTALNPDSSLIAQRMLAIFAARKNCRYREAKSRRALQLAHVALGLGKASDGPLAGNFPRRTQPSQTSEVSCWTLDGATSAAQSR